MKRSFLFAVIASLLLLMGTAFAGPITLTWSDKTTHWPGWGGNPGWVFAPYNEDEIDAIGEPQITGGSIVIDDGYLKKITFDYPNPPGWTSFSTPARSADMLPGDLFLDTDHNGTWDYVVSLYNGNSNTYTDSHRYANTSSFNYAPVYSISLPLNGPAQDATHSFGYLVTGPDNQGWWAGYDIRNNQPFAVTGIDVNHPVGYGSVGFSNSNPMIGNPLVFDLGTANIPINGDFTFGFAPNCANEVILYTTAPEPSSALLLGSGLALAAALLRRKKQTMGESHDRAKAHTAAL